jgi:hypothetical protein
MKSYVVHWEGPYDLEDFPSAHFGLYLATGKLPRQRQAKIQYCGISERDIRRRISRQDHKVHKINRDLELWKGIIKSDQESLSRNDLELIESLLVYFWQMELNEKKKVNPPSSCVVVNRWFFPDGRLRKKNMHITQDIDDVIYWDGQTWHLSQNLRVFDN